jgi:hypothetical protein
MLQSPHVISATKYKRMAGGTKAAAGNEAHKVS